MKLEVLNIKELSDGNAELLIELDEEYKQSVKKLLNMRRWNNKKFQQFIIDALKNHIK